MPRPGICRGGGARCGLAVGGTRMGSLL